MSPLRVVIVEDEELARRRLLRLLMAAPDVEIVGQASTSADAIAAIRSQRPDVVLLDVKLPGADGFEVVRALERSRETPPLVIFVTAFEEHAVQAFQVRALDYVLKPIVPARLADALTRARESLRRAETAHRYSRLTQAFTLLAAEHLRGEHPGVIGYRERVAVRTGDDERLLDVAEVDWIESAGNYVRFHSAHGRFLVRTTMQRLERELNPEHFARAHRSALINLRRVRGLHRTRRGQWMIELVGGVQLPLARSRRRAFRRQACH